jgi:succinoglycan biosynthesis protein ExoM
MPRGWFAQARSRLNIKMADQNKHVCVCICTYKRPEFLRPLLEKLDVQETDGLFSYSAVVADNDCLRSAEPLVSEIAPKLQMSVKYCVQPQQSIALARNRAVENAEGDFVAFIDDDEFPTPRWLVTLFSACHQFKADGALGPVKPYFDDRAPQWIIKSGLYDRPSYPTGLVIDGSKGRTGNVLLKREVFAADEQWFRPEFRTGEDQDFFTRMIGKGRVFVWCDEAVAFEVVPPIRWNRSFLLKRALLRGTVALAQPNSKFLDVSKSLLAVPSYALALPFFLLLGQHRFMTCLVKLCDHLGKLLAVLGINPVKDPYVTE